jgi:hypothetical protein
MVLEPTMPTGCCGQGLSADWTVMSVPMVPGARGGQHNYKV